MQSGTPPAQPDNAASARRSGTTSSSAGSSAIVTASTNKLLVEAENSSMDLVKDPQSGMFVLHCNDQPVIIGDYRARSKTIPSFITVDALVTRIEQQYKKVGKDQQNSTFPEFDVYDVLCYAKQALKMAPDGQARSQDAANINFAWRNASAFIVGLRKQFFRRHSITAGSAKRAASEGMNPDRTAKAHVPGLSLEVDVNFETGGSRLCWMSRWVLTGCVDKQKRYPRAILRKDLVAYMTKRFTALKDEALRKSLLTLTLEDEAILCYVARALELDPESEAAHDMDEFVRFKWSIIRGGAILKFCSQFLDWHRGQTTDIFGQGRHGSSPNQKSRTSTNTLFSGSGAGNGHRESSNPAEQVYGLQVRAPSAVTQPSAPTYSPTLNPGLPYNSQGILDIESLIQAEPGTQTWVAPGIPTNNASLTTAENGGWLAPKTAEHQKIEWSMKWITPSIGKRQSRLIIDGMIAITGVSGNPRYKTEHNVYLTLTALQQAGLTPGVTEDRAVSWAKGRYYINKIKYPGRVLVALRRPQELKSAHASRQSDHNTPSSEAIRTTWPTGGHLQPNSRGRPAAPPSHTTDSTGLLDTTVRATAWRDAS